MPQLNMRSIQAKSGQNHGEFLYCRALLMGRTFLSTNETIKSVYYVKVKIAGVKQRGMWWVWQLLLQFSSIVFASSSMANDLPEESRSFALAPRALSDWRLADFLLLSFVDGSLQARDRLSGAVLWTLPGEPLVKIERPQNASTLWIVEPSDNGHLFYLEQEQLVRIPTTIQSLIEAAPFGLIDGVAYTGCKQTKLYVVDAVTGQILSQLGSGSAGGVGKGNSTALKEDKDILILGRTEYILDIQERMGSGTNDSWVLRISSWSVNTRDFDLQKQYERPQDGMFVTPINNNTVIAMSADDMRPQRWIKRVPSVVVRVFDALRPVLNHERGALAVVEQPPLRFEAVSSAENAVYVDRLPDGSLVGLSGAEYGPLVASSPNARICSMDGPLEDVGDLIGVHPEWCQYGWSRGTQTHESSRPLLGLPPATQHPQLLGPAKPPLSWGIFFLRVGENVATILFLSLLAWFFGIQKLLRPRNAAKDEPKKRKRGARGGKKAREQRERLSAKTLPNGLVVGDEVLGYGSHGTIVLKGSFEHRAVAVKRMLLNFYDVAAQEVAVLSESDDHPNVVRYYCKYQTDQFLFIALELCPGTLEDMVQGAREFACVDTHECLRQVTLGLHHLHSLKIVHRDIKPQNILVAPQAKNVPPRMLISDFGLCKRLEGEQSSFQATTSLGAGTAGWSAPEISRAIPAERLTRAVDIFSLGCVFHYVLNWGVHPFGKELHLRQANILANKPEISLPDEESRDLVTAMLAADSTKRPATEEILKHPFFWSDQKRLDFLVRVSDRLEIETKKEKSELIDQLESSSYVTVGTNWHDKFPQVFVENLGKFRKYHGDRILDLLRALRNKLHHYNDFDPKLQSVVGDLPSGYLHFYTSRFPLLLMSVYHFAKANFSDEIAFVDFF